jgi:GT2 family glycosyltransferase
MYAEDLDLAWRLRALGATTRYVPAARVSHALSASTQTALAERRDELEMEAAYDWLVRRRGRGVARVHAVVNVVGGGLRLALFSVLSILSRGRFATERERERRYLRLHARGLLRPRRGHATNGQ